jgi:hypothetical protein
MSACISAASTEKISVKFGIADFHEKLSRKIYFFKWVKVSDILHKDPLCATGAGDIKSPKKRYLLVKWYQAVKQPGETTPSKPATHMTCLATADRDHRLLKSLHVGLFQIF